MTDEKKGAKTEPWIPVEKTIAKTLPTDRPYTDTEAIISLELDRNSGKLVSASGYVDLWRWGKKRFYRFMEEYRFEIAYDPEFKGKKARGRVMKMTGDSKGTERGLHNSKKSKRLQRNPDRKGTERGHNYKELNNKRRKEKESKDSFNVFSRKTQMTAERLLNKWNNSLQRKDTKGKQRVCHSNPSSKVSLQSKVYFCQLLNGTFFRSTKEYPKVLDLDWADKIGLTEEIRSRKMSLTEIEEGLALMNRLFEEGYWGSPEEFYKWSLPGLLLNPKTGESMFFRCILTDLVRNRKSDHVDPRFKQYYEWFSENGKLNGAKPKLLVKPLTSIEKWFQRNLDAGVDLTVKWRDAEWFISEYAKWVDKQDWLDTIGKADALGANGGIFRKYIEDLEREFGKRKFVS